MALGFTSHYNPSEQKFGSLTQSASTNESESNGTIASSGIIIGQDIGTFANVGYDSCEFSSPVVIDYTQYAASANSPSETAGSIAFSGCSNFSSTPSCSSSFSGGGASFSSGGGSSCASFTC